MKKEIKGKKKLRTAMKKISKKSGSSLK